jgi:hypothetical protein
LSCSEKRIFVLAITPIALTATALPETGAGFWFSYRHRSARRGSLVYRRAAATVMLACANDCLDRPLRSKEIRQIYGKSGLRIVLIPRRAEIIESINFGKIYRRRISGSFFGGLPTGTITTPKPLSSGGTSNPAARNESSVNLGGSITLWPSAISCSRVTPGFLSLVGGAASVFF